MIISKKVKMKKMGNKNLKYYIDLGYIVDNDSNEFFVNVEHLTPGSKCLVDSKCDFCDKVVEVKYCLYLKNISSHNLFACSPTCGKNKAIKTNLEKWGVEFPTQNEIVKEKTIKTNLEKWGTKTVTESDLIKEKIKQSNLEKWGVEWTFQSKEIREKSKQTLLERFGVDHNFKSLEVREKSKQTLMKNWGVDNPSKSEEIKDKKKVTSLKNWGTDIPTKSDVIKKKTRETNLKKLGVEYPMQSKQVKEKFKKTINERWGVDHNSQIEDVKKSMKTNNLKNWGVHNYSNFVNLIKDGLIHTYPIKTAVKLIKRDLNGIKASVDVEEETGTIFLKGYSDSFNRGNIEQLIRVITLCGYFPSIFEFYDGDDNFLKSLNYKLVSNEVEYFLFLSDLDFEIKNSYFIQIVIESKFNKPITNIPDKLYHVTPSVFREKILSIGLSPKSLSKKAYHPGRIYLGFNLLVTKNLAYQFNYKGEYILIEINMDKIGLNNLKLKDYIQLYDDPDFPNNGCYTNENIPPNCIKEILKFKNK